MCALFETSIMYTGSVVNAHCLGMNYYVNFFFGGGGHR